MARVILVTGGSRSGKSAYAQQLAERLPGPHTFVATCPVLDEEMRERVRRHKLARKGGGWLTVEEQTDLAGVLARPSDGGVMLVDCLTLWVNNLLFEAEQSGAEFGEPQMEERCRALLAAAGAREGAVILVTNEVGWGIVPENALARRFRDVAGRCNQVVAAGADAVVLIVCGQPITVKGSVDGEVAAGND